MKKTYMNPAIYEAARIQKSEIEINLIQNACNITEKGVKENSSND